MIKRSKIVASSLIFSLCLCSAFSITEVVAPQYAAAQNDELSDKEPEKSADDDYYDPDEFKNDEPITDEEPADDLEPFPELPSEKPLSWRVELRNQTEYLSNVDQVAGAGGDGVNRSILTGTLRYMFPTQTQLVLRSQHFFFKFMGLSNKDQFVSIPASLNVSQWFFNQLNVYAGYMPIFLSSVGREPENIQRFDHDVLGGTTFYQLIDNKHLVYGGYQFDYLLAQVEQSQFLGNTFIAGYKHQFSKDFFGFADARAQLKGFTATPEFLDEVRIGGALTAQWHVFAPYFIIESRADYTQVINMVAQDRNVGIFTVGFNLVAGVQSD